MVVLASQMAREESAWLSAGESGSWGTSSQTVPEQCHTWHQHLLCESVRHCWRGKSLVLVCILRLQGLVCQCSESEIRLRPVRDNPLARSCACKCMRTRLKKAPRRFDAIAGNIKLFAWAGIQLKLFEQKNEKATLEMWRAMAAIDHRYSICCFAFHCSW